jgi:HSP20 family protein
MDGASRQAVWRVDACVDAFQRGNEFVVRLDVPGMTRNDINVEIGDDALTISGERKQEQSIERDGMFWSERSHGTFSRVVPLPPGAIGESAKANFHHGVLEVVVQAPSPRYDAAARSKSRGTTRLGREENELS